MTPARPLCAWGAKSCGKENRHEYTGEGATEGRVPAAREAAAGCALAHILDAGWAVFLGPDDGAK